MPSPVNLREMALRRVGVVATSVVFGLTATPLRSKCAATTAAPATSESATTRSLSPSLVCATSSTYVPICPPTGSSAKRSRRSYMMSLVHGMACGHPGMMLLNTMMGLSPKACCTLRNRGAWCMSAPSTNSTSGYPCLSPRVRTSWTLMESKNAVPSQ